jgi:hypothetical protein
VTYLGLLQPLLVPEGAWINITMNVFEGLPTLKGKDIIMVIINKFTKFSYFMAITHPFTAQDIAQVFLDQFYKLHGLRTINHY